MAEDEVRSRHHDRHPLKRSQKNHKVHFVSYDMGVSLFLGSGRHVQQWSFRCTLIMMASLLVQSHGEGQSHHETRSCFKVRSRWYRFNDIAFNQLDAPFSPARSSRRVLFLFILLLIHVFVDLIALFPVWFVVALVQLRAEIGIKELTIEPIVHIFYSNLQVKRCSGRPHLSATKRYSCIFDCRRDFLID